MGKVEPNFFLSHQIKVPFRHRMNQLQHGKSVNQFFFLQIIESNCRMEKDRTNLSLTVTWKKWGGGIPCIMHY